MATKPKIGFSYIDIAEINDAYQCTGLSHCFKNAIHSMLSWHWKEYVRHTLSYYFIKQNVFYVEGCTNKCKHGGFPIKPVGGNCKCKCPPGLKGDNCDEVDTSNGELNWVWFIQLL